MRNPVEQTQSWLNPLLEERKVNGAEHGVFATGNVGVGSLLAIFGGVIMLCSEEPDFPDGIKDLALQIHEKFVIGAKDSSEVESADFFNHSCDANAGFQGQIVLVALRDIKVDEEICFDYAMAVSVPGYRFDCRCGSKNCRGTITGEDWKRPDLQKRYAGYFQWYLEKRIREMTDRP